MHPDTSHSALFRFTWYKQAASLGQWKGHCPMEWRILDVKSFNWVSRIPTVEKSTLYLGICLKNYQRKQVYQYHVTFDRTKCKHQFKFRICYLRAPIIWMLVRIISDFKLLLLKRRTTSTVAFASKSSDKLEDRDAVKEKGKTEFTEEKVEISATSPTVHDLLWNLINSCVSATNIAITITQSIYD